MEGSAYVYALCAHRLRVCVLVETQLGCYHLPYKLAEGGDLFADGAAQQALAPAHPITQVPTLMLPDGTVMTESAAISLWLLDVRAG